ncbi:hypothetical protein ACLD9W_06770 [Neisseria sp. WLZKY-1]|jgi:hypothetical protein|uniref:hypothetical protein n=1 Tax=Neisseria sp. WLZKY-1 TaxID=3390377 RepID=UPI0039795253
MANPTRADAQNPSFPISFSLYCQIADGLNELAAFVQNVQTIKATVFSLLPDDCAPLIKAQLTMLDGLAEDADAIGARDICTALCRAEAGEA